MEAYAITKHVRISPTKARLVARLIVNKQVDEANSILKALPQRAARVIEKTLNSAVANGENNFKMERERMYVNIAVIDSEGPLKRLLPRGFGRADVIRRPVSRIKVVVEEREEA